ncbi:hypothetical protein L1987_60009 [Smallanthus sonchifolius]|uniref:Uncharacterized protein n=1 Tax=Smallanthus sonchifolius TaxID=185202 RepID=A0ACB9D6V2_9ASTR|nr:hypothetical protein L1987_60009 [Smallanthus sonchifolius]
MGLNSAQVIWKFDELPPFSVGIQSINDSETDGTTYLRSDHDEGIYVEKTLPPFVSETLDSLVRNLKMPPKRKRGPAKCLKMIKDPKDFKIEFDSNGLAIGETAAFFMSWVGKAFRKKIPYYKLVKDIDKQLYNDVWDSLKKDWKIPNDDAKSTIIKQGKVAMRNFRYTLVNKYAKKNKSPIEEYEDLDMSHWDSFVSKALSEEFEYCKEIEMKENGTYYVEGKDVVTEVVGKGRQHGGRTLLVSDVIGATKIFVYGKKKKTTKQADTLREEIDALERDKYRVAAATQASSAICLPEIEQPKAALLIRALYPRVEPYCRPVFLV